MDTPMGTTTNPTNEIIDMDAPNTVAVTRDVLYELAAVSAAILDKRAEKTQAAKKFSIAIKDLEKRQIELIDEVRSGGTQLAMNFGTRIETIKSLTQEAADLDAALDEGDDELEDAEEATGTEGDDTEPDDEFADDEQERAH